ncbi:alkaline phosphatase D family protein [Flavicella marina]|uniref:alkaline phosphatase D family protein n=1 Tax=Flavicella marina TaxID=1475951 RepID=UPI001265334A|nr:alkaline phosphatase D family protein [Flavicella marina]
MGRGDRRSFIKKSILGASGVFLAPNIISCDTDVLQELPTTNFLEENSTNFNLGIASFDPTDTQVIIWTRYLGTIATVHLEWQIATDLSFGNIVRYGRVSTDASRDYTMSIEVQDLQENQNYFYRFIELVSREVSEIGETKTFSKTTISELKIGVTSCSNYEIGYFNVYKSMAESDIDLVLHLGDYLYEQSASSFGATEETIALGRTHLPSNELLIVEDYRTRYRQYRSDEDLKKLHQLKPFICVWDDHEIANDAYKEGASSHQENEGDFLSRKQQALQAYSEYLPFKSTDESVIYRSFVFGDLLQLTLLDTRLGGRDKQLSYGNYSTNGVINQQAFQSDWLDTSRTILGTTQKNWFLNEVANSNTEWLLVGQQVLMGKMYYPVELVQKLTELSVEYSGNGQVSEASQVSLQNQLIELVTIKERMELNDPTLSEEDKLRVSNVLPFNLDSWDGYPIEREVVLQALESKKSIVVAGDSHNAWFNEIIKENGTIKVPEFATASVTSPGFENLVSSVEQRVGFQTAIVKLVDQLSYFNSSQRGYVQLTIQKGQAVSEWIQLDTVLDKTFVTSVDHTVAV